MTDAEENEEFAETDQLAEEELINRRRSIKGSLTRIKTFVNNFTPETGNVSAIVVRKKRIEEIWAKYEKAQDELEAIDFEKHSPDREIIENNYMDTQTKIEEILQVYKLQDVSEIPQTIMQPVIQQDYSNLPLQDISQLIAAAMTQQSLPVLNIKAFSGKYEEYKPFIDLFDSIIHNNHTLPDVQKFYHLKSLCNGEVAKLLENLSMTADNYKTARQILEDRYNNEQFILNAHLRNLFEGSSMAKESVTDLRNLISRTKQELQAISNMGIEVKNWDHMIIYVMKQRVDQTTRRQWELTQKKPRKFPTLVEFYEFLEQRCFALEASQLSIKDKTIPKQTSTRVHVSSETRQGCQLCKGSHQLFGCDTFKSKSPNDRLSTAKTLNICFNCLRPGHSAQNCKASKCKKCNKLHNTMLHLETPVHPIETQQQKIQQASSTTTLTNFINEQHYFYVFLPTAEILIQANKGEHVLCKALLDSGSQSNFITESLVKSLKLKTTRVNINVSGITNTPSKVTRKTSITLRSKDQSFQITLSCLVVPKITEDLPAKSFDKDYLNIPTEVQLADSSFNKKGPINLLIGSDTFWNLLKTTQIRLHHDLLLQDTVLGHIVTGKTIFQGVNQGTISDLSITNLHDQIETFWKVEDIPITRHLTTEEKQCEEHFVTTHSRTADGRYEVRLPLKNNIMQLGNSLHGATERLQTMERKMNKNPEFNHMYHEFMDEYIDLGHMTEKNTPTNENNSNYLPHHAVIKATSSTTRLRVVFDASYKTTMNNSLNDFLMVGPKIQDDSWDICLRFRYHTFVITADIAKMYRQILIHKEDRRLQQILWRKNITDPIKAYELNTVTYGMACSPFLAVRCLQQLATEHSQDFPKAASILSRDFYVDDLLTGSDTIESLRQIKADLIHILKSAGFELRKWKSNTQEILDKTDHVETDSTNKSLEFPENNQQTPKTLGIRWNAEEDIISYQVEETSYNDTTKRQILSQIAKLYDPLGLIAPLIIRAKMIMQTLWQTQRSWDEMLPHDVLTLWKRFKLDLLHLKTLKIPRLTCLSKPIRIEIHTFADASTNAYGTAIYIRTMDAENNYKCRLICAKSRVAPLKTISVPRLELCAAVLASQLTKKVQQILKITDEACTLWTDSTIVLAWIKGEPSRYQTFVANRISEIQQNTNGIRWKHILGKENPADFVSRGLSTQELINSTLWWNGPSFLENSDTFWSPTEIEEPESNILELKPAAAVTLNVHINQTDIFQRFSSWTKLVRTLTYWLRFYKKLKHKITVSGPLTVIEIQETTKRIIKSVQQEAFSTEIQALSTFKPLHRRSKLLPLHPFLKDDLLRVGGRLTNSTLTENHKHPILLPKNHHITQLIFQHLHKKYLHCGPEQLLSIMRHNYWPIAGRQGAKQTTSRCIECFIQNPMKSKYLMGNLPPDRVNVTNRPFCNTGIDYAGPIFITESRRRGRVIKTKAYVAVFVCLNTKATHLELVSSLTTECFLAALRRFNARRGIPTSIYCDNGTTFVGANRELSDIYKFIKNNETTIFNECSNLNISWHFQPPRAPNFGGLWEAAVKSFKRHFYKVTKECTLTFEECYTLLTQIESVLNSRPLTHLSTDPHDYQFLTPGHFLIGDTLLEPPEHDYTDVKPNRLTRFKYLQQIRQNFWKRWQTEYLHTLQTRSKWQHESKTNLKPNDLVLIVDNNAPPLHWRRGRVLKTHPGQDGIIRVVTIRTSNGTYKRPVTKICRLPID